jgi:Spy/CpxP family protein refolding chaperone
MTDRIPNPLALVLAVGIAASSTPALAQGPLSGPAVESDDLNASLVERNIDGTMRRLELPPAEAALELMEIDGSVRADIDAYLAERAAVIDAIVQDNLETLQAFRSGNAEGRPDRREQFRTLRTLFAPVLEDGPLEARIADLLPESQRAEYAALIEEHRDAMRRQAMERRMAERGLDAEMLGDPMQDPMLFADEEPPRDEAERPARRDRGARPGARGGQSGETRAMMAQVASLRHEIRRSVERVVGEKREGMDRFVAALDLTAEQQSRVEEIFARHRAEQRGEASVSETGQPRGDRRARMAMMREIAEILTPEQRTKFRELIGRGGREQRPAGEGRRRRPVEDPDD